MTLEEKYEKLLIYVRDVARLDLTENDMYERLEAGYISVAKAPEARKVLREIGELPECL